MRYIEKNSHVGKKKVFENQRLVARKTYGLSRRQQRFKSAWGRQQTSEGASLYSENQGLVVCFLYYPPSACKALSQGFQAASSPSTCATRLSPSSAFYLRVPSLNISLPREAVTNRGAVLQALISSRRSVSVGYPLAFSAPRSYLMKYDRQLIPLPRSIMKTSPLY